MTKERLAQLVHAARAVAARAHAPYSKFQVGAALLADDGNTYLGCNVENASFGATVCAERSAVSAMVAAGGSKVLAVAVYTNATQPTFPCGVCRQVLSEFAQETVVIVANDSAQEQTTLAELLPHAFVFES
ncbi:MAG TPA: cytidine deaminase [Polyangiaceae bacterium]|nr:cytidine deaminase [Polyangiaceae bacterium]